MIPNEVYILGGGASIKGHEKEIREMIKGKFSIGLNYSYRHFDSTLSCYVDEKFYKEEHENMKDLNLVVGKYYGGFEKIRENNTLYLNARSTYKRDIKDGVYKSSLVGIWATTLAIYLMKEGNIFWCYDKKTEVFTNEGWKYFKDLKGDEKILTRKSGGNAEWSPILAQQKHYYDGEMYHLKSKGIDLLVTPEHKFCLESISDYSSKFCSTRPNKDGYFWKTPKEFTTNGNYYIPRTFNWKGKTKKYFKIPNINKNIKMENWLKLLGWFLTEGCCFNYKKNGDYGIEIYQNKSSNEYKEICNTVRKCGFHPTENYRSVRVYSKKLMQYFKQFGLSKDKFVPREILNLDKKYLRILLKTLIKGDGHINKRNISTYYTVSKQLADDVQELAFKCGYYSSIYYNKPGVSPTTQNKTLESWVVYLNNSDKQGNLSKISMGGLVVRNNIKKEKYNDWVYDITVNNHTLFVRRDNVCCWSGNCGFDYGSIDKKSRIDKKIVTHYYQGEINHRGIGKVSYYENYRRAHRDFGCYSDIKGINIYNVSPDSQIHDFPRIDYYLAKEKISKRKYNQKEIVKSIKEKLKRLEVKKR